MSKSSEFLSAQRETSFACPEKRNPRGGSAKILARISRSKTLLLGAVWGVSLCSAFSSPAALRPLSLRGGLAQALPLSGRSASLSPVKMTEAAISTLSAQRCTWQQTMLRIKDPKKSVAFYQEHFGMTLIDKLEFPQYK